MRIRNLLHLGWISCLILLLQGCWDIKDIDNRLLAASIGIEQAEDNKIQLWVRFPIPQSSQSTGGGLEQDYFTVRQKGITVVEAFDALRLRLPKYLDLSETRDIFLDQKLAEKGFLPYLEFTIRDRTLPLNSVVAVVSKDMEAIFTRSNPMGELSGIYTKLFFERYAGGTAQKNLVPLWGMFSSYYNPLEEVLVPILNSDPVTLFKLKGNAFFTSDKMSGMLTPEETLIYEIVTNKMAPFEIETAQEANVKILESKATTRSTMKGGKPIIRIHASLTMTLMDSSHESGMSTTELETSINRTIEERAAKVFRMTQEKKSDIFGFGNHYRSILPSKRLKNWPELYQQASIEFKLDSELRDTGLQLLRRPFMKTIEENPPQSS